MKKLIALIAIVVLSTSFAFAAVQATGTGVITVGCPGPINPVATINGVAAYTANYTAGTTAITGTTAASVSQCFNVVPTVSVTPPPSIGGVTASATMLTSAVSNPTECQASYSYTGTWSFATDLTVVPGNYTFTITLSY